MTEVCIKKRIHPTSKIAKSKMALELQPSLHLKALCKFQGMVFKIKVREKG